MVSFFAVVARILQLHPLLASRFVWYARPRLYRQTIGVTISCYETKNSQTYAAIVCEARRIEVFPDVFL